MVVMALDHVREYWSQTPFRPEDLAQTSVLLFFTRWVTHFCAPVFVFLCGVSIAIRFSAGFTANQRNRYLLVRGVMMLVLEVVVVTFLLQFGYNFILLQVIWVIGWGMVTLALLQWLPNLPLAIVALLVIVLSPLLPAGETESVVGTVLAATHVAPFVKIWGSFVVVFSYPPLPWIAVLWLGFAMGGWVRQASPDTDRKLRTTGWLTLVVFVVVRLLNGYGDPAHWAVHERGWAYTALSFVNVSKYPPSPLFLCLTLGTALLVLAYASQWKNGLSTRMAVLGKVPMFYYLIHIFLINASALVWVWIAYGRWTIIAFDPANFPPGYQPSLGRTYLVWMVLVVVLYFLCVWWVNRQKKQATEADG